MRLFEPLGVGEKSISSLTELEVRSAIRRRERSGDLSADNVGIALTAVANEITRIGMEPVTDAVLKLAAAVIDGQGLRALDAIQLATALLVERSAAMEFQVVFVTFDNKLLLAAEAEGLSTWRLATGHP